MKKLLYLLLFFCSFIFSSLYSYAQPYAIGQVYTTWNDAARSRDVTSWVYYPGVSAGSNVGVAAGSFPVIVFGHGFSMNQDAYANIKNVLVPKGYIVVMPTTEGTLSPSHGNFGGDIAFLVGKMQSEGASNASPFYNHVEVKTGIMGHSMGGGSAFLAAENNAAITTMVTMAAAETNPSAVTAAANITIPALVMAGADDCVAPPASNQVTMYNALASGCKTYISIKLGSHCYFADYNLNCTFGESTCNPTPDLPRADQQDVAADLFCLWFDHWLKGSCPAWEDLQDSLASSARITSQQSCAQPTPSIGMNSIYLEATPPGFYYQWYYEGNEIPGANGQLHFPEQDGYYTVGVNYETNCPVLSAPYPHNVTGVNDPGQDSFSVMPNPASDFLLISGGNKQSKGMVKMYDATGALISSAAVAASPVSVNISSLSAGVYFIIFATENGNLYTHKFVKR